MVYITQFIGSCIGFGSSPFLPFSGDFCLPAFLFLPPFRIIQATTNTACASTTRTSQSADLRLVSLLLHFLSCRTDPPSSSRLGSTPPLEPVSASRSALSSSALPPTLSATGLEALSELSSFVRPSPSVSLIEVPTDALPPQISGWYAVSLTIALMQRRTDSSCALQYLVYLTAFSYIADSYLIYASSALSAMSFVRNCVASVFPLFTPQVSLVSFLPCPFFSRSRSLPRRCTTD
jgi:hypothetical protein